jgi:hypothetical protein
VTCRELTVSLRLTITSLACISGAIVAGIALARPGEPPVAVTPPVDVHDDVTGGRFLDAPPVVPPTELTIADFAFSSVSVAAGETVTVVNRDAVPHTVTGDAFDTGSIDGASEAAFSAPATPGTFEFFCAIHPSMRGVITVVA